MPTNALCNCYMVRWWAFFIAVYGRIAYHSSYYAEKFKDDTDKELFGVYIDITGNKEIFKRPEMVHLLRDCKKGKINLISSQTRAYLAANTCEFCFLLQYLFG